MKRPRRLGLDRAIAVGFSFVLLAGVDAGLRVLGVVPPADPVLLQSETLQSGFFPFTEERPGTLTIRRDWASTSDGLRVWRAPQTGTTYLLPSFRPSRLTVVKPDSTVRIFVLGGSVTFGLYVGREDAFAAVLQEKIEERRAGRDVQVVNLGSPGWSSERVAQLLETLLTLDPDLLIVLTGHNEMLHGGRALERLLQESEGIHTGLLRWSIVYRWMNYLVVGRSEEAALLREEAAASGAQKSLVHNASELPPSERRAPSQAQRSEARRRFGANLERMAQAGIAAGVPVLFVVPEPNLLFPPVQADLDPPQSVAELEALIDRTDLAIRKGRYEDAVSYLRRAVELSPRNAQLHYQLGAGLLTLGRAEEAVGALERAVEQDVQTHRILPALQEEIVRVAERTDAPFVDLRAVFRAGLTPDRGRALFVDHVHPTQEGHRMIAEALVQVVEELTTSSMR